MRVVDITGQRFGRLTVVRRGFKSEVVNTCAYWVCQCDCGNEVVAKSQSLRNGSTTSCGCYQKEMQSEWSKKHGMCGTKIYKTWKNMKSRCTLPSVDRYPSYGGRGIAVCDEWFNDFQAFYDWALDSGYSDGLTIDRIDVDGDYEPSNCRWVPHSQQQGNTTRTHFITYNGETHNLTEWAALLGISRTTLNSRINRFGWSMERVVAACGGERYE